MTQGLRSYASIAAGLLLALALVPAGHAQDGDDCVSTDFGSVRCIIPLAEDTLFFLENRGVSRVLIDLNGHRFKLASDPEEVARSVNAFPIPRHGELTIDISEYMLPGFDANVIEFITQGPADTDWRFVIAPEYVEGQMGVAYAIEGLVPFPEQSALLQNFPNPFRESTTFTITVAEDRLTGMHLRLEVFDIRGRRVRSLLDDMRFPGAYEVEWDGRDDGGTPVASGIYLVRLLSERYQHVVRITRLH